jgi:uncharacterized protein (DUF433 family)
MLLFAVATGLPQSVRLLGCNPVKVDNRPLGMKLALLGQFGQSHITITSTKDEQDVRELPAYGIAEAAHYLLVPRATLRSWMAGMSYGHEARRRLFKPVIEPAAKSPVALSFINLIEAHVLGAIRRQHRVDMPKVRGAIDFLKKQFGSKHPLADHKFETNGVDLFVEHFGAFISASEGGQIAVRELLKAHLRRIDRDDKGFPLRLYPFTRVDEPDQPKNIVIDPFISFGKAVITGTGVSTNIVAERFKAGESADELANDYGCAREKIEEAIRCELSFAEAA